MIIERKCNRTIHWANKQSKQKHRNRMQCQTVARGNVSDEGGEVGKT